MNQFIPTQPGVHQALQHVPPRLGAQPQSLVNNVGGHADNLAKPSHIGLARQEAGKGPGLQEGEHPGRTGQRDGVDEELAVDVHELVQVLAAVQVPKGLAEGDLADDVEREEVRDEVEVQEPVGVVTGAEELVVDEAEEAREIAVNGFVVAVVAAALVLREGGG